MSYCRELKFEEKPDYNHLRRIFKDLFNKRGYEYDYVYDWDELEKKNRRAKRKATAGISAQTSQVGINQVSRPITGRIDGGHNEAGMGVVGSQYQQQVQGIGQSNVYTQGQSAGFNGNNRRQVQSSTNLIQSGPLSPQNGGQSNQQNGKISSGMKKKFIF